MWSIIIESSIVDNTRQLARTASGCGTTAQSSLSSCAVSIQLSSQPFLAAFLRQARPRYTLALPPSSTLALNAA